MPTALERSLGPEIYKKAKELVEAAGPDFDWTQLKEAVDKMMEGASKLQDIDFDELYRTADESVQLLKVCTKPQRDDVK